MPRHQQVVRQWRLLAKLDRSPAGVSVAEIAGEDSAKQRAFYRDLDALQEAGFPLYVDEVAGRRRWKLTETFRGKQSIPLSLSEILTLRTARSAFDGVLEDDFFAQALSALIEKLDSILTPQARVFAQKMDAAFVGDRFGRPLCGQDVRQHLETVSKSIGNNLSIDLIYCAQSNKQSARRVDPYNIWLHRGGLYLVAWCHTRKAIRAFSFARIISVNATNQVFVPQPDYDFNAFVRDRFRIWGDGKPERIEIWFSSEAALYVRERIWHPTQEIVSTADGGIIVRMESDGMEEISKWVLSFGPRARVISPDSLVQLVTSELHNALDGYSRRSPVSNDC